MYTARISVLCGVKFVVYLVGGCSCVYYIQFWYMHRFGLDFDALNSSSWCHSALKFNQNHNQYCKRDTNPTEFSVRFCSKGTISSIPFGRLSLLLSQGVPRNGTWTNGASTVYLQSVPDFEERLRRGKAGLESLHR